MNETSQDNPQASAGATTPSNIDTASVPDARVSKTHRLGWIWLLPIAAAILAGVLVSNHVVKRGPLITIRFEDGHGLKPADALRCRGIEIGRVESVVLDPAMNGVLVRARLEESSKQLASAGTAFWIVRPQLRITEVTGLDTVTGPRYIAVRPGRQDESGKRQKEFVGLNAPPVVSQVQAEGLEITLEAVARGSVVDGSPITYRQVVIGRVLSVELASDARSVEIAAYIRPRYKGLVRENTKFWNVSGVDWSLGWSGVRVEAESVQALLDGGVAIATPNEPGGAVTTGHRFKLEPRADSDWAKWRPPLVVGHEAMPPGVTPPTVLRATAARTGGRLWNSTTRIKGWVVRYGDGLLGPAKMLAKVNPDAHEEKAILELKGITLELDAEPRWLGDGLAFIQVSDEHRKTLGEPMTGDSVRTMEQPEDCIVLRDGGAPIPIAASRLKPVDSDKGAVTWHFDATLPIDPGLRGAVVVARRDGKVLGQVVVEDGRSLIAPPPSEELTGPSKGETSRGAEGKGETAKGGAAPPGPAFQAD